MAEAIPGVQAILPVLPFASLREIFGFSSCGVQTRARSALRPFSAPDAARNRAPTSSNPAISATTPAPNSPGDYKHPA
jgi:hypothetical protein